MNYYLLVCLLFSVFHTSQPDNPPQFRTIKLSEFTRGTMRMIEATPKQIIVVYNSERNTGIIDPAAWDSLVEKARKLPLDNLESVPVLSKKHQVDAALHASLTFVMRDTSVFTPTFDHNAPPEAYKPLIESLYQLVPESMKKHFPANF